jgi:hypothetical protein
MTGAKLASKEAFATFDKTVENTLCLHSSFINTTATNKKLNIRKTGKELSSQKAA